MISDGQGWTRRLPLTGRREFSGPAAVVSGTLSLRRIRALLDRFEAQTGTRAASYSLRIVPRVTLAGRVDGQPVGTTFSPALDLRLDTTRLAPAASTEGAAGDPLTPQRSGSISRLRTAHVALLGASLSRPVAIGAAAALAASALALALFMFMRLTAARRGPERDLIRLRLGHRLVHVTDLPRHPADRIVPVERIEDLMLIAERGERPILALEGDGPTRYALEEGGLLYRYDERPRPPAEPEPAPAGGGG